MNRMPSRRTRGRHRLLWPMTTRGLLGARVCPLCGALIVTDGAEQHEAVHRAGLRSPDPPCGR